MRAAALVLGLVLLAAAVVPPSPWRCRTSVSWSSARAAPSPQEMTSGFHEGVGRIGGVSATVTGPPGQDGHKEVELFRGLTMAAKGGIAVATSEPALMAPSIGEALTQHVAVLGVDMRLTASSGVKLAHR